MLKTTEKTDTQCNDFIMQDGIKCPKASPWEGRRHISNIVMLPLLTALVLGTYILVATSMKALIIWYTLLFVLLYPLRYMVCARCPYYGQNCYTPMGKLIPHLFPRQQGKSMKLGLWLDIVIAVPFFLMVYPFAYQLHGWRMVFIWFIISLIFFTFLTQLGCLNCPFAFCPVGKMGRQYWSLIGSFKKK